MYCLFRWRRRNRGCPWNRPARTTLPELLGDVVICLPIALRQAAEYGHSSTREVLYLAVHGLLHLLGFDHQTAEERRRMRDAEEKFLAEAGWGRNNGEDHAEE